MRARATQQSGAPHDQDQLIAATVRALAGAQQMSMNAVARSLGMQQSTFHRRMTGGFLASDVKRLSLLFGVPVGDLYDGLGGAIRLPRRDSNLEPSDYRTLCEVVDLASRRAA